jgi:peptidyl-dipeptidase Dcp
MKTNPSTTPSTAAASTGDTAHKQAVARVAELKVKADADPMLAAWTGPWGGVPPWDKAKAAAFPPAFETGLTLLAAEIDAIATDPEPPTFKNTIAALENAGRHDDRAETLFGVLSNNLNTEDVQKVDTEWSPKITAAHDAIVFNDKLFSRIAKVYEGREKAGLTTEQKRLVELTYDRYVRAGAKLNPDQTCRFPSVYPRGADRLAAFPDPVPKNVSLRWIWLASRVELPHLQDRQEPAGNRKRARPPRLRLLGADREFSSFQIHIAPLE